jgi:hypothetical protein
LPEKFFPTRDILWAENPDDRRWLYDHGGSDVKLRAISNYALILCVSWWHRQECLCHQNLKTATHNYLSAFYARTYAILFFSKEIITMPSNRSPEWRGISRIDYKHTHGWFARVYLTGKQVRSKLFSDNLHASSEEALAQAREWRDREEAQIAPEDRPPRIRYLKTLPKSNTSGRVGISRTFTRSKADPNKKLWCFNVSWASEPGKPRNSSFYFNTYGSEEAAFQAACEFRAAKEREVNGNALSAEERERQRRDMIAQVMTYFDAAPPTRRERLRQLHALILEEFPDATLWLKNTLPCYQRGERWVMLVTRTRSLAVHCHPMDNLAAFFPDHPTSLVFKTCVHYRDDMAFRLEDVRHLIRAVLDAPEADALGEQAVKAAAASAKARTPKGRARITTAIKRYIQQTPESYQSLLWNLHAVILDACPIVRLRIENGIPAYEHQGAWMIVNTQQSGVSVAVSQSAALAEFVRKYPQFKSGNLGLTFTKATDLPLTDFRDLAAQVLNTPLAPSSHVVPVHANAGPSRQPARQAEQARGPKHSTRIFAQTGLPVLTMLDNAIEAYLRETPHPRQDRLRALHAMLVTAFPDLKQSLKFRMPTYEGTDMWMSMGEKQHGIAIHVKNGVGIEEFAAACPGLNATKTWVHIDDTAPIAIADFHALIQRVFGETETAAAESSASPAAIDTPVETIFVDLPPVGQLTGPLASVIGYMTACPVARQPRLLLLHSLIVQQYPHVHISMRLGMPTYDAGDRWLAIANHREHVSLYVDQPDGFRDFSAAHPAIKTGKHCLYFADSDHVALDEFQMLIRKALLPKTSELKAA